MEHGRVVRIRLFHLIQDPLIFFGLSDAGSLSELPVNRQIFDYMKNFARHYNLYDHITFNTEVTQTTFANDVWDVTLAHGETRQYRWMVCVSGTTWHPKMPAWASQTDAFDGEVRHANSFRHMDEFRGKRVLVVGAGNSGCDIACDAAVAGDAAFINVRRGYHFVPKHIMGKPADVFGDEGPHAVQRGRCPRDAAAAFGLCLFHHVDGGDGPYERQRSVFMKDSAAYSASKLGQKKKQVFLQRFQTK